MNALKKIKFSSIQKKIKRFYKQRQEGDHKAIQKEILAHKELASFYENNQFNKNFPHAQRWIRECYRAAALLGDTQAGYRFANLLINDGNFWEKLSNSIYGVEIHKKYAALAYEQAHIFIDKAVKLQNPLAKRLKGLAFMKGWGVEKQAEHGAKMIIDSIKEEGAWDKAKEIFDDLGLHSPEIFSSLIHQAKNEE